jgi:hypothetical protein
MKMRAIGVPFKASVECILARGRGQSDCIDVIWSMTEEHQSVRVRGGPERLMPTGGASMDPSAVAPPVRQANGLIAGASCQ